MNKEEANNQAYWERNQLVSYLSKMFPSWLERHPEEDTTWKDDWRNIVFIELDEGLYSWHIHDSEIKYFGHLTTRKGNSWDGSTTEEKYSKLGERVTKYYWMDEQIHEQNLKDKEKFYRQILNIKKDLELKEND